MPPARLRLEGGFLLSLYLGDEFLDVLCPQVKTRHFRAVKAAGFSGGRIVLQNLGFFLAGGTQEGFVVETCQLDAVVSQQWRKRVAQSQR
jgi:hypothetical protein